MRRVVIIVALLVVALPGAALAGWSDPTRVATGASEPHIALADDGSGIAVWRTRTTIRAARLDSETGQPGRSRAIARGRYSLLRLSASPFGRAVTVWRGKRGRLYASVRAAGGEFSAPRRIATAHGIFTPDVKVAANGVAVAVWSEQLRSGTFRVRAARLPATGKRFGAPFTVKSDAQSPRLDIDADGDAIVAYYTRRASGTLAVRRISSEGALGTPQPVASRPGNYRVTLGPAGHALLAWTTFNDGLDALNTAYAAPGEPLVGSQEVASDLGRQYFGTGVDAQGNATLFWIGLDRGTTNYHLRFATRTPSQLFGSPTEIGAGYFDYARLAVNPRGDAIAAWWGDVGQEFRHLGATRSGAAGLWSPSIVLGSAAQGNDFAPDVSIDGLGRGVAVWLANPDRTRRGVGSFFYANYVPD